MARYSGRSGKGFHHSENGRIGQGSAGKATYPLGRLSKKSFRGPSAKLVTRNQLVWRLSLGPVLLATAYLRISRPLLVGWISGVSARLPIMEMRATDRGEEVLKERAAPAEATVARRRRKDDIVINRLFGERLELAWQWAMAMAGEETVRGWDGVCECEEEASLGLQMLDIN